MSSNSIVASIRNWPKGIRFYIGLGIVLVTAQVYWYIQSVYGGSSVAPIRLQETYAWIAVAFLFLALSIGPLCAIFPKLPGKALLRDARRLLGIGAAWFAGLHVGISYIDQFDAANPFNLPGEYQKAFAVGIIALLILVAMALTSFNAAFRKLGAWWFRLHRLVYVAVLLILFHAFSIGVHATTWPFIIALAAVTVLLFALHFYQSFGPTGKPATTLQSLALCYGLILTVGIFAYGFTQRLVLEQSTNVTNGGLYENR